MIKKALSLALLTSSLFLNAKSLSAEPVMAFDEEKAIMEKIKAMPIVKAHKFVPEKLKDGGSLLFVKGYFHTPRRDVPASMFVTKDYKTMVYGRGFDSQTTKEYHPFSIAEIKEKAGLIYGSGTDEYILVVDPLCSACVNFEKTLPLYEKEIKLYVLFMPLSMHKTAPEAVYSILSEKTQEDKWKKLQSIAHGSKDFEKIKEIPNEYKKYIKDQRKLAMELGVKGTPTLFTGEGSEIDRGVLKYMHDRKTLAQNEKTKTKK